MAAMKPYAYQEKVSRLLLEGKSVLLQAPTGAGKTRAAILPFLHGWRADTSEFFPTKCIYTVPMRVLAHQFVNEYEEIAASIQRKYRRKLAVSIQTGDRPEDQRLESDLIFCTIDQFLSSYLTMPYGLPSRLANLNAGAAVGSYLVFDEFHLLDPNSTLPTTLHAIKQLHGIAPALLMTATFSRTMLQSLADYLDAEVVLVSPEEARKIENRVVKQAPRQRVWQTADSPLSAEAVLKGHQKRSLALCNTVGRAQTLYRDLCRMRDLQNLDCRILLLHSRFLPADRLETETELRRLFGKEADQSGSVIAVATQTIEVGVDITCETLHTELAPASSLIQRAGRCARFPGEQGRVVVYPVESYMPYGREKKDQEDEVYWVKEMRAAFAWLQENDGTAFDFGKEQKFVDAVATPRDQQVIEGLSIGRVERTESILRVLSGDRQSADQRLLVRDADSRLVLVHSDPQTLLRNPYGATGFSLQPGTLYGMLNGWLDRGMDLDLDRSVMRLESDADIGESNRTEYSWLPLNHQSQISGSRVILVNSALAGYLRDEGFVADRGDTGFESLLPPASGERTWEGYSYKLESYEEHIRLVLESFQEISLPELRFPAAALEKEARVRGVDWREGSVLQAAWLICLLHDVGKLSVGWQRWARAYQSAVGKSIGADFAAAHTDSEWRNDAHKAAAKTVGRIYPKPHHAGEGALATAPILFQLLEKDLARAALTAITRHHTPFARECQAYELESSASEHILATLPLVPADIGNAIDLNRIKTQVSSPPPTFANLLIRPDQSVSWLAYTLLARALRRSDQAGTAKGTQ